MTNEQNKITEAPELSNTLPMLPEAQQPDLTQWLNWSFATVISIIFLFYILPRFFAITPDPANISSEQLATMLFSTPIIFFITLCPATIILAPQINALHKLKLNNLSLYYIPIASLVAFIAYIFCAIINSGSEALIELLNIKINPPLVPLLAKECTNTGFMLIALAVIIIAPLTEEIVFRRIIFSWLAKYTSKWGALIVTSALFAIVHDSFAQFPALFALAIGLQLIYLKYNSLIPAIIMHASFNAISASLLLLIRIGILPG